MRCWPVCAAMTALVAAGCDLGVVDYSQPPSPALMVVASEIETDTADADRVVVTVSGTLNPGIGQNGFPRSSADGSLIVQDSAIVADSSTSPFATTLVPQPRWKVALAFPAPAPESVRLTLPHPEGLGPSPSISMRVRVATTPEGLVRLSAGEDLVLTADRPSSPADMAWWEILVRAENEQNVRLRFTGDSWPDTLRVPSSALPTNGFPYQVAVTIRWTRARTLIQRSQAERYDLLLHSTMRLHWTLEIDP